MTGVLLGDGTIGMNGHHALLSIQQTDEALVNVLWSICNEDKLVNKKVQCLYRFNKLTGKKKKVVYYFQTLTFPYFTSLFNEWYILDKVNNARKKILPANLEVYLTPMAIAYWTMGDGTFDKGRGQRIILCTDSFSLNEVNRLRSILLEKYNINSYVKASKSGQHIFHRIAISGDNRIKYQKLISCYILPSLLYRIGL
jgi:LAGLIDADG DNA endonuclease family